MSCARAWRGWWRRSWRPWSPTRSVPGSARSHRTGWRIADGYRPRAWDTRAGEIELRIPMLRSGSYFPSFPEPQRRAEQALVAVVQEAYVTHDPELHHESLLDSALRSRTVSRRPRSSAARSAKPSSSVRVPAMVRRSSRAALPASRRFGRSMTSEPRSRSACCLRSCACVARSRCAAARPRPARGLPPGSRGRPWPGTGRRASRSRS